MLSDYQTSMLARRLKRDSQYQSILAAVKEHNNGSANCNEKIAGAVWLAIDSEHSF